VGTRFTLAGLVCAVLLIPLASASASTTVGSSLVFDGTGAALADCDPLCTFIPTDVAIVGSGPVTSPIDGVVVRWGTSAADPSGSVCTADPMECTSTVRLRVIASQAAAPSSGLEAYVQATVEPDADRDRFRDETQDQCPGSAGSQNGCPPAQPSTHARKKCKKKHKKRPHVAKKKCKRKHRK
jgi:hypothetical protein